MQEKQSARYSLPDILCGAIRVASRARTVRSGVRSVAGSSLPIYSGGGRPAFALPLAYAAYPVVASKTCAPPLFRPQGRKPNFQARSMKFTQRAVISARFVIVDLGGSG
jgi:hypothetical protein